MSTDTRLRKARSLAKQADRLARLATEVEHLEDAVARQIAELQDAAQILDLIPPDKQPGTSTPPTPLRAMLIINSKSGPKHDSLEHVGELVDLLAGHGIAAEVHVKLHSSEAHREARAAAKAGYALVVAAGGDGTVEAVASGLVGSQTMLGIIPLGTYNNVATSLGIPTDLLRRAP